MHKKYFLPVGILLAVTILSAFILTSSVSLADTEKQADATVTVSSACTMFRDSTTPHITSANPNSYTENIGTTRLKTICNDKDGYAIYAIGYSNDTDGDTNMYGEESGEIIPTGTASGDVSNWSMKLTKDTNSYNPENLTIVSPYNNYAAVPSVQTKVASFAGATDTTEGSVVETTYAIRVSSSQMADTYTGQVKYTMVHPADGIVPDMMAIQDVTKATCSTTPTKVYDVRDNEIYTIQKLADGNCWMLENLRLDPETLNTTITTSNTNMDPNTPFTLPESDSEIFGQFNLNGFLTPGIMTSFKDEEKTHREYTGKVGVFYNYCAASAGTICSEDNYASAKYDICPKGWRMPTGGSSGEYKGLYVAYNSNPILFMEAMKDILSGLYSGGSHSGFTSGMYWTSSNNNEYRRMYSLNTEDIPQYDSIYVDADYSAPERINGLTIRCIAYDAEPEPEKIYIQDVTLNTCSTEPMTVYDRRDEQEYTIQKLADGNCWLLDNLRLDSTSVSLNDLIGNTNASATTLGYFKNGGGTSSDNYAKNGVAIWNSGEDYSSPLVHNAENDVIPSGGYQAKVGSYYNYCAASAGSFCYSDASPEDDNPGPLEDICPSGWHLPVGGEDGEFVGLYSAYGNSGTNFISALRLPAAGYYSNGSTGYLGDLGFYWSATKSSGSGYVHRVYISGTSTVNPNGADSPVYGEMVRCVANKYLQDIDTSVCSSTPSIVYDKRDGERYMIKRLGDGNCWMLDNLRLGSDTSSITLTAQDTNMDPATTFTLPASATSVEDYYEPRINAANKNDGQPRINGKQYEKVGVFYNFCAASAGSVCTLEASDRDTMYDICPKGWRLPKKNEFSELRSVYENYDPYVLNALYSSLQGYYTNQHVNPTYVGYYWASTAAGDAYARYTMNFSSSSFGVFSYRNDTGYSVRCLQKEPEQVEPDQPMKSLQNTTTVSCPTTPTLAYDERDDEEYYIQKLADGRCWMLENLRLDPETLKTPLTTSNTNMSPDIQFTLPASTASIGNGPTQYTEAQINTDNKNVVASYAGGTGKTGVFYNYCAITAGTICVDENTQDAQYDICPAGWHLPSGGDNGEYNVLFEAYDNSKDTFLNAIRGVLGGFRTGTSVPTQGQYSMWVSSTHVPSSTSVYGLSFSIANDVYVGDSMNYAGRNYGVSVRCVADQFGKEYIQNVDINNCPTRPTVVYDRRDDEEYTIQKLADGNCWLLENLRLDLTNVSLDALKGKTNASDTSLEYLKGTRTGTADDKYATDGVTNWTEFYSYSAPLLNASRKDSEQSYGEGSSKDGIYYNYCAATAGTYCYGDGSSYGSPAMNPTEDICPSGWRMPAGSVDGEYQALFSAYSGDSSEITTALRIVKAGYVNSGLIVSLGYSGLLASSTRSGSKYSYNMTLSTTGDIMPQGNNNRILGTTVRCIAKNNNETKTIQDITLDTCPSTPTTVIDSRDGNSYTIQRLEDGNCWMLDNLNLGRSTVKVLTPEDTNISDNFTLPGSVSTGFSSYVAAQINTDSRNDTASYGDGENKIGVYYNLCAASAGTYCDAEDEASGNVKQDICPKGWRLPTGGESGEYQTLISEYDDAANFKNALRASLSGYFKNNSTNHQGRTGSAWTSTSDGADHIYSLDVRSTKVLQDYKSDRNAGISIRCIAKNGTEPRYIQDVTKATCPTTTTTVYDKRDGQPYTIKRIDDDCWMTENLNLAGGTALTPELSNVATAYTLPASTNDSDSFRYNNDEHVYNTNNTDCSGGQPCYSYYTLKAALAGELNPGSPATQDICPAGWQIPDASKANEFRARYVYNLSELPATEWNPERNGYIYSGTSYNTSQFAYYWTSTNSGTSTAYRLRFMYNGSTWNDIAVMGDNNSDGLAVRCIAK